ncbi:MAG: hypothetical protein ABI068_08945, partial [Ktedonobacterales bacterium]
EFLPTEVGNKLYLFTHIPSYNTSHGLVITACQGASRPGKTLVRFVKHHDGALTLNCHNKRDDNRCKMLAVLRAGLR